MNNKYSDHVFKDYLTGTCDNCGFGGWIEALFSCKELQKISESHTWFGSGPPTDLRITVNCTICNISGVTGYKCYLYSSDLYTCNEYLMIKANE